MAEGIMGSLNPDQLQFFKSQGYLVVESFARPEETEAMMKRMNDLLHDFDCSSIYEQQATTDFLLESAEKISFFFEGKALGDDKKLKQSKQLSVKSVGHALHELDRVFKNYSHSDEVSSLLLSLGYKRPVIIQSGYIFKQPHIGDRVEPHQDSSFLYTEPTTCVGFWLALEDATIENGCLRVIPGSHKNGLARRFLRGEQGLYYDRPAPCYDQNDFVPIEVKAGSLILIHGNLVHQSFENKSQKSRHAYSFHVVDTDGCKLAPDNWIRRKVEPEPLYVS